MRTARAGARARRGRRRARRRAIPTGAIAVRSAELPLTVDRERARFSTWYELFPRSAVARAGAARHLPRRARRACPTSPGMGFDVLYLPPIHPIGRDRPQGPEQHARGRAGRRRQPVGHRRRRGRAQGDPARARHARGLPPPASPAADEHGIEIALDIAFQCAPDHPYVERAPASGSASAPDGTHPVRREPAEEVPGHLSRSTSRPTTGARCGRSSTSVFDFWIAQGVRIFRVDNPHTKPFAVLGVGDRARSSARTPT